MINDWKHEVSWSSFFARLTSPTPVFWKKIKVRMVVLGSLCAAFLTANYQLDLNFSEIAISILKYGICVGITGTTLSQTTIK
jgi:hypothetical protein